MLISIDAFDKNAEWVCTGRTSLNTVEVIPKIKQITLNCMGKKFKPFCVRPGIRQGWQHLPVSFKMFK
jgi:hypothetical protein